MSPLSIGLCLSMCLTFGLPAQEEAEIQDTQETQGAERTDVRSRVGRVLKGLQGVPSFECKTKIKSRAPSFLRQLGGGKYQTKRVTATKEGDLLCWTKSGGDQVLASQNGRWVVIDRDGDWIPCRRPQGNAWKSEFLTDPVFLAGRLLHLLPKAKWQASSTQDGGKPLRIYKTKLELDEANHLVRTGALPEGGGLTGMMTRAIVIGGGAGGGGMQMPEAEREIELEIYEDPKTRLPVKIVARTFAEENAMGGMRIAVRGMGGDDDEDEDEDDEDKEAKKKKKPAYTMTIEISKVGEAKASQLPESARKMLQR